MAKPLEDIDYWYDPLGTLFVEADDPELLKILEEEKGRACLNDRDIKLFLPELGYASFYHHPNAAEVEKQENNEYWIILYPAGMRMENCSPRRAIRHELAHIRYGDCDRELPRIIRELYRMLIEEPRARRYETR